jgi:hypothetical protein
MSPEPKSSGSASEDSVFSAPPHSKMRSQSELVLVVIVVGLLQTRCRQGYARGKKTAQGKPLKSVGFYENTSSA